MSTTVSYKGNTIATVENNTKTLKTAGKYLEGDVVLTDVTSGGGSSNVIVGTFTTNSTNGTQTINVPYLGNGFLISLSTFLSEGAYNKSGTAYSTIHQYGMVYFNATKCNHTTPNYSSGTNDNAMTLTRYKSSTTNATSMSSNSSNETNIYDSINGANSTSPTAIIRIQSPTSLSIYVSGASSTYGFLPSTEYTYVMSYSS